MGAGVCVACRGFAEPPLVFVVDEAGRPTGQVVCQECLTAPPRPGEDRPADGADTPAAPGGG